VTLGHLEFTDVRRALELQNTELRAQVASVKTENLEVSEKIVLLDAEVRGLKAKEADLETAAEVGADADAVLVHVW
jgi:hypothetical protein